MKRKNTLLEENLINKCWSLAFKTYCGNHKDRVQSYVYQKEYIKELEREDGKVIVLSIFARVVLDSKRVRIVDIYIESPHATFINEVTLSIACEKLRNIKKEVNDCYPTNQSKELTDEEQVEVAEVINESNE